MCHHILAVHWAGLLKFYQKVKSGVFARLCCFVTNIRWPGGENDTCMKHNLQDNWRFLPRCGAWTPGQFGRPENLAMSLLFQKCFEKTIVTDCLIQSKKLARRRSVQVCTDISADSLPNTPELGKWTHTHTHTLRKGTSADSLGSLFTHTHTQIMLDTITQYWSEDKLNCLCENTVAVGVQLCRVDASEGCYIRLVLL